MINRVTRILIKMGRRCWINKIVWCMINTVRGDGTKLHFLKIVLQNLIEVRNCALESNPGIIQVKPKFDLILRKLNDSEAWSVCTWKGEKLETNSVVESFLCIVGESILVLKCLTGWPGVFVWERAVGLYSMSAPQSPTHAQLCLPLVCLHGEEIDNRNRCVGLWVYCGCTSLPPAWGLRDIHVGL